jgi:3,4-dihydroxy 2-butanone 4-phosphate synthase / GTP cyclohydrolase II
VGVICELANDDGTVMRGDQIDVFAQKHGLKRIAVADLIAYRQSREKLVERIASFPVETPWGSFTGYSYSTPFDAVQHVALVHGRIGDGRDIPVRLHRADSIADIFEGGKAINAAMKRFVADGRGVLVYLRDGTAGVPTTNLNENEETASEAMRSTQWREIGLGAQILRDLGVASIRNLATSSRSYVGLSGFGIDLVAEEPLEL